MEDIILSIKEEINDNDIDIAEDGSGSLPSLQANQEWESAKVLMLRCDYMEDYKYDKNELSLPVVYYLDAIPDAPFNFSVILKKLLDETCEDFLSNFDILVLSPFNWIVNDTYFGPSGMNINCKDDEREFTKREDFHKRVENMLHSMSYCCGVLKEELPSLKIICMMPHPINYSKIESNIFNNKNIHIEEFKTSVSINQYFTIMGGIIKSFILKMPNIRLLSLIDFVISDENRVSFTDGAGFLKWVEEIEIDRIGLGYSKNIESKIWEEIQRLWKIDEFNVVNENENRLVDIMEMCNLTSTQRNYMEEIKLESWRIETCRNLRISELEEIGINPKFYYFMPEYIHMIKKVDENFPKSVDYSNEISRIRLKMKKFVGSSDTDSRGCLLIPKPIDKELAKIECIECNIPNDDTPLMPLERSKPDWKSAKAVIIRNIHMKNYKYSEKSIGIPLPDITYLDVDVEKLCRVSVLLKEAFDKMHKKFLQNYDILIISPFDAILNDDFLGLTAMTYEGTKVDVENKEPKNKIRFKILGILNSIANLHILYREKFPNLNIIWMLPHPINYNGAMGNLNNMKK